MKGEREPLFPGKTNLKQKKMKTILYTLALGLSLSTLMACDNRQVENADGETSPGVTGGGTGAGTTATGVGTSGTPGGLTEIGDTVRTDETNPNRDR